MKLIAKKLAASLLAATFIFCMPLFSLAAPQASTRHFVPILMTISMFEGEMNTNDPTDPVDPPTDPVDPPTEPVDPPTDPVDPPTDPVDPPTDPVDPPTDPVDPPTAPVDPPTDPVEPATAPPQPTKKPVQPQTNNEQNTTQNTVEEKPTPTVAPKKNVVERPKATLKPDFSTSANTEPEKKASNYVTFAVLSLQENSMSRFLFVLGAISAGVGVLGIGGLIFFHMRSKRAASPENQEIFQAIQEAENRSRTPQNAYADAFEDYQTTTPQEYAEAPYDDSVQDDYTAGYEQAQYENEDPYAEFATTSEPYGTYDDYAATEEPVDYPPQNAPAPASYNTEEILREALNYNQDDNGNSY